MNIIEQNFGPASKHAAFQLAQCTENEINHALALIADNINANTNTILAINKQDVVNAQKKGASASILDRLTLTLDRIKAITESVRKIAELDDPNGKILSETLRPNGLIIQKKSCPLGVLGIIYEARPNVTVDAAALCLKSHNAVILRGGSECHNTAYKLYEIMAESIKKSKLPNNSIQMIPDTNRKHVGDMLKSSAYIDVIVPRGGKGLTSRVISEATMPVFAHLDGICHTYIHHSANPEMAVNISLNAKMRRTGICGATETILFDKNLNIETAKNVVKTLLDNECLIVSDSNTCKLDSRIKAASDSDWSTEYLDKKVSIRYVENIKEAISHINKFGSHHTDAIIAEDHEAAEKFFAMVDSANVMHNCSTQFADGGEFGMGAEIGIATGKFHARGPVGVEQLMTYKYIVKGSGQTRPT